MNDLWKWEQQKSVPLVVIFCQLVGKPKMKQPNFHYSFTETQKIIWLKLIIFADVWVNCLSVLSNHANVISIDISSIQAKCFVFQHNNTHTAFYLNKYKTNKLVLDLDSFLQSKRNQSASRKVFHIIFSERNSSAMFQRIHRCSEWKCSTCDPSGSCLAGEHVLSALLLH